jgi:hypothetical protein
MLQGEYYHAISWGVVANSFSFGGCWMQRWQYFDNIPSGPG